MAELRDHPPQGALRQPDGSLVWHVWAPLCSSVALVTFPDGRRQEIAMAQEGGGYFTHREARVDDGTRYALRLPDGHDYPDPASRWQPDGVHRPSAVFSPGAFHWSDEGWRGVAREDLVLYELHVGTFTPAGTFAAAIARLSDLASLGVTAVELMPVAQFAGRGTGATTPSTPTPYTPVTAVRRGSSDLSMPPTASAWPCSST